MLRKIMRNFVRWLIKATQKLIKVIGNIIARILWRAAQRKSAPRVLGQKNGEAQSQPEAIYQGRDGVSLLKPSDRNIEAVVPLLREKGPHSGHDVIVFAIGSAMGMLIHVHDFIMEQSPDSNGVAIIMGASCTDGDDTKLTARERAHNPWVRRIATVGSKQVYVDRPATHRIISRKLRDINSRGGYGGDQLVALTNLQIDPFTAPDVEKFVKEGVRAFSDYDALGCTLVTIEGGGGTPPLHWYGVDLLKQSIHVNRHIRLILVPSAQHEPLHIPNMRGTLADIIATEDEEEPPTLYLLLQQEKGGRHATDKAVISALVTLTGNAQTDAANKFNLIFKTAGKWLTAHPRIVELPLKGLGELECTDEGVQDDHHEMSLRESLGGKRAAPILRALYDLAVEDKAASHFMTVAAFLHPDEAEAINEGVKRFALEEGGQVHVLLNSIWPEVPAETNMAEVLICDLRAGPQTRKFLEEFLGQQASERKSDGTSWPQLRDIAAQVSEREMTEQITQELKHIREVNHR